MDKKGAIEFSMTTIMIIIIGVAVLSLGLAWVSGTFTKIGTLTDESIAKAETILFEGTHLGKISAPSNIKIDSGEIKKFEIWVRNDLGVDSKFKLGTMARVGDEVSGCSFTLQAVSASALPIKAGEEDKFIGVVQAGSGCGDGQIGIHKVPIYQDDTTPNIQNDDHLYGEEGITFTVQK